LEQRWRKADVRNGASFRLRKKEDIKGTSGIEKGPCGKETYRPKKRKVDGEKT